MVHYSPSLLVSFQWMTMVGTHWVQASCMERGIDLSKTTWISSHQQIAVELATLNDKYHTNIIQLHLQENRWWQIQALQFHWLIKEAQKPSCPPISWQVRDSPLTMQSVAQPFGDKVVAAQPFWKLPQHQSLLSEDLGNLSAIHTVQVGTSCRWITTTKTY